MEKQRISKLTYTRALLDFYLWLKTLSKQWSFSRCLFSEVDSKKDKQAVSDAVGQGMEVTTRLYLKTSTVWLEEYLHCFLVTVGLGLLWVLPLLYYLFPHPFYSFPAGSLSNTQLPLSFGFSPCVTLPLLHRY
jgi:hypothetical protein